ncbi:MAG: xanthine dehydrogenase small subunit [Bacteroidales bacterium]|nr:xanthine dehydrogenase small subunit [Bacteroidales bacterium]
MQKSIKFILDGEKVKISINHPYHGFTPTTTLLDFLRSQTKRKGVKEGCSQGDCGACTVVLAEPGEDGKLIYKAVNSCLVFLPMVHGKQVITIENLSIPGPSGLELHPVQQALLEHHGIQCGFCTPGMVMSLFVLFKNYSNPSLETVKDALTGNLCRCTGYQSIVQAALSACNQGSRDHFSIDEDRVVGILNDILENRDMLEINDDRQRYLKPFLLWSALKYLKMLPEATIFNGATDVALRQTQKGAFLKVLLDLSSVKELRYFREEEDRYRIGAGLTIEELKKATAGKLPAFHQMLQRFGSLQIRNLATLGGNLAGASPIGDTIPLLLAYKASVQLSTITASREIGIDKFLKGYHQTDLQPDELITEIVVPKTDGETKIAAYKVSKRNELDISTVSAAFRLKLKGNKVSEIILAFGGMAQLTIRAKKTERFVTGKVWSRSLVEGARHILDQEMTPISDARAEASFRISVAKNLLLKFYLENKSFNDTGKSELP